jgi:hypothetical protein
MDSVESTERGAPLLGDVKVHVRLKLSALWAGVMFCYVYGDIFGFFKPGTVKDIVAGKTGFLGTQSGLLAAAALMAVPSVMVFLSLALPPRTCRYVNIGLGLLYTAVIVATMPGAWEFYIFLGVVEAALTLTIVAYAWRWPKADGKRAGAAAPALSSRPQEPAAPRV